MADGWITTPGETIERARGGGNGPVFLSSNSASPALPARRVLAGFARRPPPIDLQRRGAVRRATKARQTHSGASRYTLPRRVLAIFDSASKRDASGTASHIEPLVFLPAPRIILQNWSFSGVKTRIGASKADQRAADFHTAGFGAEAGVWTYSRRLRVTRIFRHVEIDGT